MKHRSVPDERSFGFSVGGVLLAIAAWVWWRDSETAAGILATIGGLLAAAAALAPSILRRPKRVWFRAAHILGWINSRILLGLFFAIIITPVGVVMRMAGRNPLRGAAGPSNWAPYPQRIRNPHHFDRLF